MIRASVRLCARLAREDGGQDLIEYALLTAIVSVGSLLVFDAIRTRMGDVYIDWGAEIQEYWEPAAPIIP